ncbi:hypothetical protein OS493_013849 [Desmophyllum pertusum]|uniref:VWFA domain-containing protein n=1 Tax=Desmophyllum pertusum TaxID=174260 RepID=A0A9X0D3S1_9CNID|nr:hypothetical protein OS493_013849 [Desmophyllum pertusum]
MAADKLFSNVRQGVPRVLVVLTDGASHDDVVKPSEALRNTGVMIFSVGLGTHFKIAQLNAMASDPKGEHVFTVDFPQMATIITAMQEHLCKAAVKAVAEGTIRDMQRDFMSSLANRRGGGGYQVTQTTTTSGGSSSSGGVSAGGSSVSGSVNGGSASASGGAGAGGGCDLAFMVDVSSSIGGDANFQLVMKFVTSIFHSFTMGGAVRYGLVVFGSSAKVVFGFSQYTSISEVDSAVASVTLMGGSCSAGAGLTQCKSALFDGDAGGKARVLIVLMAGSSSDDVSSAAGSLKTAGCKIIAVGMGGSFVQTQLSAMAFSSSYVLSAASFSGLAGISGSMTTLISQGMIQCKLI